LHQAAPRCRHAMSFKMQPVDNELHYLKGNRFPNMLHDDQVKALTGGSFVRNTFIDIPMPCLLSALEVHAQRVQSRSCPPRVLSGNSKQHTEPKHLRGILGCGRIEPLHSGNNAATNVTLLHPGCPCQELPSHYRISSSISSGCGSDNNGTTTVKMGGREHCLARLVIQECGFLRVKGYKIQTEKNPKILKKGGSKTVRFYVKGLPAHRRSKWMHPLLYSVAAILHRKGLQPSVISGDLLVQSAGCGVRLEFTDARDEVLPSSKQIITYRAPAQNRER